MPFPVSFVSLDRVYAKTPAIANNAPRIFGHTNSGIACCTFVPKKRYVGSETTLMISVLIARAATALGTVVTATDYMWMGVYAGFFFSRPATRAHVTLIAISFGAALL